IPNLLYWCFLEYPLSSIDKASIITGSAQPQITLNNLEQLRISLAPLNEQRGIVAKLDKLMSRVHAAQARLANIPHILKRFRESILSAASSGQLTTDWRENNPNTQSASELTELIKKKQK